MARLAHNVRLVSTPHSEALHPNWVRYITA